MRCVRELGAVGSFIRPNLVNGHYWHSNYWDPLYTLHEDLDVTWGFHEGTGAWYSHMNALYGENRFYRHVASHWIEMQQALIAMIIGGVFEFHPKLRVGFLEAQNSWVPGILSRIEWDYPQYRDTPRAVPVADAEGVLPAQLLGGGRGQRAGDRGHGGADRRRPHVHLDRLPALRLELPERVEEPAQERARARPPRRSSWAARTCTASPTSTSPRPPRRPPRRSRPDHPSRDAPASHRRVPRSPLDPISLDLGRRALLAGAGSLGVLGVFRFAFAETRTALPGGGSVIVPAPYKTKTDYPNYAKDIDDALIGYRNWRSTMSGHPECDGMIGVGRTEKFRDLKHFVGTCRAGLSIQWRAANTIPGQPWDGNEKRYQESEAPGPHGIERTSQLSVVRVGWWSQYNEPARLYAVQHAAGVSIGVWLYDKHGGEDGARRMAHRIAESFQG